MTRAQPPLRGQRLRLVNHQGDALRLGMNWTEEDLGEPQVLVHLPVAAREAGVDITIDDFDRIHRRVPVWRTWRDDQGILGA